MKEPLVSIVIPTYGGGEYLQKAVNSVLNQTYKNIEVIVVDDNGYGTENQLKTAFVMSEFAQNPKVKYFTHEVNKNGSAARNTGVKKAKGSFIALLDDDDEFFPENIEKHIKAWKTLPNEYAITYCGYDTYKNGKFVGTKKSFHSENVLYDLFCHVFSIGSSVLMIRKGVYDEFGGFDESFRRHQDWEFTQRVASKYKVYPLDSIGCKSNLVFRNSPKKPDIAKKYREHYLDKMSPYIEKLPVKKQKHIYVVNRLDIAVQYLKIKDYKSFSREYRAAKPGLYGIVFITKRFVQAVKNGGFLNSRIRR